MIGLLAISLSRAADAPDFSAGWTAVLDTSGAQIWVKALPESARVRVGATFPVGQGEDPPGLEGLAQVTAAVLWNTLPGRSDAEVRSAVLDRGGSFDWSSDAWHTGFYVELPIADQADALRRVVEQLFARSAVSEQAVASEKRKLVLRRKLAPKPWPAALQRFYETWVHVPTMWEESFGLPPAGVHGATWESVQRIGVADVKAFWRRWYGPQNVVLSVIGADPDLVHTGMHDLLRDVRPADQTATSTHLGQTHAGVRRRYTLSDDVNGAFSLELHLPDATADDFALGLLLRGLMRQGLHDRLRVDEKAAYSVEASELWSQGNLAVTVASSVDPDAVDSSMAAALNLLDQLRRGSLPDDEYDALREHALAPLLTSNLTPAQIWDHWLDDELWDRDTFREFPPLVATMRATDQAKLGRWVQQRLDPGRRVETVTRPLGTSGRATVLVLVIGALLGLRIGGKRWFQSPLRLTGLRYVRKVRYTAAHVGVAGVGCAALVASLTTLGWPVWREYQDLLEHVASPVVQAVLNLAPLLLGVAAAGFGSNYVPRRVLLFEHELRVKSFGWRSWGVPWSRVLEVEHRSGWLASVAWVRIEGRRPLAVHTAADLELIAEIRAAIANRGEHGHG